MGGGPGETRSPAGRGGRWLRPAHRVGGGPGETLTGHKRRQESEEVEKEHYPSPQTPVAPHHTQKVPGQPTQAAMKVMVQDQTGFEILLCLQPLSFFSV